MACQTSLFYHHLRENYRYTSNFLYNITDCAEGTTFTSKIISEFYDMSNHFQQCIFFAVCLYLCDYRNQPNILPTKKISSNQLGFPTTLPPTFICVFFESFRTSLWTNTHKCIKQEFRRIEFQNKGCYERWQRERLYAPYTCSKLGRIRWVVKLQVQSLSWQRLLRGVQVYFHSRFSPISSPCVGL